jgi:hypothetical protein
MSVRDSIDRREIDEVLHFTTNHGCLGTLYTNTLQSRQRLEGDPLVEYLFKPNVSIRKDAAFIDHVSLSIGWINSEFFSICAGSWHRAEDIFWVILSFDPSVLEADGVVFSTTNNIYSSVRRGDGEAGLEALYAPTITQYVKRGAVHAASRTITMPPSWPTCAHAEALYPGQIATSFLRRIYTRTDQDRYEVLAFLKATWHPPIDVVVDASRFEGRPR